MATRIDVTIEGLHQLRERIDHQQLEGDDWVVVGALVSTFIARTEARQSRLKAKADQQAAQEKAKQTAAGPVEDVGHSPDAEDTAATGESSEPVPAGHEPEEALGLGPPARADSTEQDSPKKGHGRNGTDAYTDATTCLHALAAGVLGSICNACGVGRITRYRDKVILRIVGQSLFAAVRHEFEQGRCRLCGAIFTAEGPEQILRGGIGTSYILYDWSACAMLSVMHYFAGVKFRP